MLFLVEHHTDRIFATSLNINFRTNIYAIALKLLLFFIVNCIILFLLLIVILWFVRLLLFVSLLFFFQCSFNNFIEFLLEGILLNTDVDIFFIPMQINPLFLGPISNMLVFEFVGEQQILGVLCFGGIH